jgi:hypothetical protein
MSIEMIVLEKPVDEDTYYGEKHRCENINCYGLYLVQERHLFAELVLDYPGMCNILDYKAHIFWKCPNCGKYHEVKVNKWQERRIVNRLPEEEKKKYYSKMMYR